MHSMDRELLKGVSRSFYLSMAWLPPAMRDAVALAYMLARATDSVADTSTAAVQDRADALRRMAGVIAGAGEENPAALCQTLAERLQMWLLPPRLWVLKLLLLAGLVMMLLAKCWLRLFYRKISI